MQLRSAFAWSAFWILAAVAFGVGVTLSTGADTGLEFFTAYLVEQSLSVDNLFVMMLLFARFRVPRELQPRVLAWGIGGVIVLRGVMIVGGTAAVEQFHVLTYALGGLLLYAAIKLARSLDETEPAGDPPGTSRVRSLVARVFPISDSYAGDRFTVVKDGVRHATPLLLALVTIETADAIFALDSIPAVIGVTTDRFVVFTSNLFAVLGLRSMYFALSGLLEQLRYLKHGLVGVLALIGTKMVLGVVWPAPAWLSLVLVAGILAAAIVASLMAPDSQRSSNAEQS
jgi:tellurite resistance protein TerC